MHGSLSGASRRRCGWCVIAYALWAMGVSPAFAQGADDQYDVTVKMEMAGMPMSMPPMTSRVCVRKGGGDADFVPHQDNCRVSDAARTGPRLTFRIACTGNNPMTGTGEFMFAGDGYNGQIRMKGKMDGQDVDMTQQIAGRRSGACTAR
jgi:uncharacterized protein DUF3617